MDNTYEIIHTNLGDHFMMTFKKENKNVGKISFFWQEKNIYIKSIFVFENYRGKKISGQLFSLFEKEFPDYTRFFLETKERSSGYNKLVKLYESWGFKKEHTSKTTYFTNWGETFRCVKMVKN